MISPLGTAKPDAGGVRFVKGHGTENDFILLPDPDSELDLTPARVRALCDRRAGLGADGVIRVAPDPAGDARWFMDYRNADGSLAQMCGNGARVFARYLVSLGWVEPGTFTFATRGGVRTATVGSTGDVTIGMGPVRLGVRSAAGVSGRTIDGLAVDVGNPHLACVTEHDIDGLDLTVAPDHDPAVFPEGVNVEFIQVLEAGPGGDEIRMRVHERGSGETRSCGTGTVAAAAAALDLSGRRSGEVTVGVPGGRVVVRIADGEATLTGPAVLVASGVIDPQLWDRD